MKKQQIEIKYKKRGDSVEINFKKSQKKINLTSKENKIELKKIYDYLEIEEKEKICIKECKKFEKPSSEGEMLFNNCIALFTEIQKELNK